MFNSIYKILTMNYNKLFHVYDNGGKTYDRITIIKDKDYYNGDKTTKLYNAIGASETGYGFYQHTSASKGRHLGKKIKFTDLHKDLQQRVLLDYELPTDTSNLIFNQD